MINWHGYPRSHLLDPHHRSPHPARQTRAPCAQAAPHVRGRSGRAGRASPRRTLQLIEKGDAKVEIGLAFEAAIIAGVSLFVPEASSLAAQSERVDDKLALLPRSVRRPRKQVDDDF